MEFIDERGRLFGLVNVIDALVVLLVLAVLVAGLALVYPSGAGSEPASRYATVELAQQPEYVADRISAGDSIITRAGNVTVTDVYVTDAETDTTVAARVEINGTLVEREDRSGRAFVYDEEPLRAGRQLDLNTTEYTARGIVTNVSTEGGSLPTERTSVRIQTTVSAATADAISTGDTSSVAGDTIATVEDVAVFPNGSAGARHVALGVELETLAQGADRTFAGRPTTVGSSIPLRTDAYAIEGTVTARGSTEIDVRETDVVLRTTVTPEVADRIEEGDAFRVNNRTVADVESVVEYPRAGTVQRTMALGVSLRTLVDGTTRTFAGTPVRLGEAIPFRTDSYDLAGRIVATGTLARPGQATTTTAVVEIENVPPAVADEIDAGDTEVVRDRRLARVESVRSDNATVILTSESGEIFAREHPRNRDVTVTVDLATRRTPDGLRFHGRPLEVGSDVVLELDGVTVSGRVTRLQG